MVDPEYHRPAGIRTVNIVLKYFYLGLMIMCIILSLASTPRVSKLGYTVAMLGFATLTIYITVSTMSFRDPGIGQTSFQTATFLLAAKGIRNIVTTEGRPLTVEDVFSNSIFRNIIFSLWTTLGFYVSSSLVSASPCMSLKQKS